MTRYFYEDFIYANEDVLRKADSLMDLSEELQDEAIHIWLNRFVSWYTDIYPASFNEGVCKLATEMLFGKARVHSSLVSKLFVAMAEDSPDSDKDDLYMSEALGYVDNKVKLGNFADVLREDIYLYLESSITSELFDQLVNIQARYKYENFEE